MKKLSAPLRLTWDWEWPPVAHRERSGRRISGETASAIGAEIVAARVLMLEVGYPDLDALRSGELAAALTGFTGSISLVLDPATAAALEGARPWDALGAAEVWLDATPGGAPVAVSWPAVRFYPTRDNLDAVAAGIEAAVAAGATALSLPNLPLFGQILREAETVTPDARQMGVLAGRIAGALRGKPDVDLRIHHYGLWQALREAGVQPQEDHPPGDGCQAGSALAYIDPTGVLFPCASLPVPLARMGAGAIGEAWSGNDLRALREEIKRLPANCAGCVSGATCRGGCRGWAHYLSGSWDATGPDCCRKP